MIFEALATPYRISFGAKPEGHYWNLDLFVLVYFCTDLVSQFFLSINVDDDNLPDIMDPGTIIISYLKGWFLIDLLATFPFGLVFGAFESLRALRMFRFIRYLRLVKLMRMLKLERKMMMIENALEGFSGLLALIKIFKIILILVFLSHFAACIWYMVGSLGLPDHLPQSCKDQPWTCEDDNVSWLTSGIILDEGLDKEDLIFQLYINTIYFCLQTMSQVGYGDMGPRCTKEKIYLIFFFGFAVTIFGSVINELQNVIKNFFAESIKHREVCKKLAQWGKFRDVPLPVRRRLKSYIDWLFLPDEVTGRRPMQKKSIENMFKGLSPDLRRQVRAKVSVPHLDKIPYLSWVHPYEIAYISLAAECWAEKNAPGDPVIIAHEQVRNYMTLMDGTLMLFSVVDDETLRAHTSMDYMTTYCQSSVFDFGHEAVVRKKKKFLTEIEHDVRKRIIQQQKAGADHLLEEIEERLRANLPQSERAALASAPEIFGQEAFLYIGKAGDGDMPSSSDTSWYWPYSAWSASYSDILFVPLVGVRRVLDGFPFLWPLFEEFRSQEVANLAAGQSVMQVGCGENFMTTLRQPAEKRNSARTSISAAPAVASIPTGEVSAVDKFVGTWTYLNASREYTITKLSSGHLQFMQVDLGNGRAVSGIMAPLKKHKDGEVWQAELSNMGAIQVRHFWDPMGEEGHRQDERLATRYQQPGVKKFPTKEVVACRHVNEVAEIKDMDRANKIYSEMRNLQMRMNKIMDRYGILSILDAKARAEAGVAGAVNPFRKRPIEDKDEDGEDPHAKSAKQNPSVTKTIGNDAVNQVGSNLNQKDASQNGTKIQNDEDDDFLQEKERFMANFKGMVVGKEMLEQMWLAKYQQDISKRRGPGAKG